MTDTPTIDLLRQRMIEDIGTISRRHCSTAERLGKIPCAYRRARSMVWYSIDFTR